VDSICQKKNTSKQGILVHSFLQGARQDIFGLIFVSLEFTVTYTRKILGLNVMYLLEKAFDMEGNLFKIF